ncbi:hypothetical protein ABZX12_32355 [Kribbella sp. NPDC003505]|uniref:hypothetical protein n=1 Tax=Kribbella sp. NPDC003505 TaxID=3154448 RepID=UPI0033BFABF3
MAVIQVDEESPEYKRFAELYKAARALRPNETDLWEGDLYATVGEGGWGAFVPGDGSFKLSKELVLDQLGPDANPHDQVQALSTILHETNHARAPVDAPKEPNAVRSRHSKGLDEGLTEYVAVKDVAVFAASTGYGELPEPKAEYPAAYRATDALLEYAAGPEGKDALADRAIDQPVVMRWDAIADEIVRNRLGDVVPQDPQHQQAARAELINAMTGPGWRNLDDELPVVGNDVAQATTQSLDDATDRIREHYAENPTEPYPSKIPNFEIANSQAQNLSGPQNRTRAVRPATPCASSTVRRPRHRPLSTNPPSATEPAAQARHRRRARIAQPRTGRRPPPTAAAADNQRQARNDHGPRTVP